MRDRRKRAEGEGGENDPAEVTEDDDDSVIEKTVDIREEFPNCDGIIINNLPEDITEGDINVILNAEVLNSAENITIHPTGTTRSRLIKGINFNQMGALIKKIENKSFKGRLLHCKPHVPVTPPKPIEPANSEAESTKTSAEFEDKEEKEENSQDIPKPSFADMKTANEDKNKQSKPAIPGLPEQARLKALKEVKKKKKKGNKEKNEVKEKVIKLSTKDFVQKDFVKDTVSQIEGKLDDFQFSDYSDEESDIFEDSKEDQSDNESIAKLLFKAASMKRNAWSPADKDHPVKSRNKSQLPLQ